jgi:hypothetical protein
MQGTFREHSSFREHSGNIIINNNIKRAMHARSPPLVGPTFSLLALCMREWCAAPMEPHKLSGRITKYKVGMHIK